MEVLNKEFQFKIDQIQEQYLFLQAETHNLVQFQKLMEDIGLIKDQGSVNNEFIADLRANNTLLKDVNQLNVLATNFQQEMVKSVDEMLN